MTKIFNTAGPCVPGQHYMIDPLARLNALSIEELIDRQCYCVLHAPHQSGKTTSLLALMQHLNAQGKYYACYANIEGAQTAREDVKEGVHEVCGAIADAAKLYLGDERLFAWQHEFLESRGPHGALRALLARWSQQADRPIVLMLDDVDALVGDTLVSLLRQIRGGYAQRPTAFPHSIILCGVRDVRDYRIRSAHDEIILGGSAFNIKTESLRLGNFTHEESEALWHQHEAETGQRIDPAIFPELWEDTCGQPWLVNALGREMTVKDRGLQDRTHPIPLEAYKAARERLIQSRATHLDQLADTLQEKRVRPIIGALLSGEPVTERFVDDDLQYLEDLGLIRRKPQITISNRIYREVIPRELIASIQEVLAQSQAEYLLADGRLDTHKLLTAFQQFFREHSEAWLDEDFEYREAGPQLLMQAYLQRIVNDGGRISHEYGLEKRHSELYLEWPLDKTAGFTGPLQRVVFELKLLYKWPEITLVDGLEQAEDYANQCGADETHLVIFDRRPGKSWKERISQWELKYNARMISVWGL